MLKIVSPLVVVEDIGRSRHFYEQLLGQKVKFDFGPPTSNLGTLATLRRAGGTGQ